MAKVILTDAIINEMSIREINRHFRNEDESDKFPICGNKTPFVAVIGRDEYFADWKSYKVSGLITLYVGNSKRLQLFSNRRLKIRKCAVTEKVGNHLREK